MPPLIFIDANIYLTFYEAKRDHLHKLLSSLKEASKYIFITEQIVDEVRRNQVRIFTDQAVPSGMWLEFGVARSPVT